MNHSIPQLQRFAAGLVGCLLLAAPAMAQTTITYDNSLFPDGSESMTINVTSDGVHDSGQSVGGIGYSTLTPVPVGDFITGATNLLWCTDIPQHISAGQTVSTYNPFPLTTSNPGAQYPATPSNTQANQITTICIQWRGQQLVHQRLSRQPYGGPTLPPLSRSGPRRPSWRFGQSSTTPAAPPAPTPGIRSPPVGRASTSPATAVPATAPRPTPRRSSPASPAAPARPAGARLPPGTRPFSSSITVPSRWACWPSNSGTQSPGSAVPRAAVDRAARRRPAVAAAPAALRRFVRAGLSRAARPRRRKC